MSLYSLVEMGKESVGEINGLPGSGKSALVVYYFLGSGLVHKTGPVITNIELDVDECAAYLQKKFPDKFKTPESVTDRIIQIPPEWWERMAEGATGIAEYLEWMTIEKCKEQGLAVQFRDKEFVDVKTKKVEVRQVIDEHALDEQGFRSPLNKAMIFLDEAHKPYPSGLGDAKGQTNKMLDFVSTIRHRGAKLYFITQDHNNMARKIRALVQWRVNIQSAAMWHIPFFGIPYGWCLQFIAKYLTGNYRNTFTVNCYTGNPDAGEKLELTERHAVPREIFQCYKSHNNEGGVEGEEEKLEWERYNHKEFWSWSWQIYKTGIVKMIGCIIAFLVFIFPGMLVFRVFSLILWGILGFVPSLFGSNFMTDDQPGEKASATDMQVIETKIVENEFGKMEEIVLPQLRLVGSGNCVFSDGSLVEIGEASPILDDGVLVEVDVKSGKAVFSSGRVLRLSSWLSNTAEDAGDIARVQGRIPATGGNQPKGSGSK